MSIDKELLDRLMEGRSPGDLFGKTGILAELTKALAERALSTEMAVHLDEERAEDVPEGGNPSPNRRNGSSQKTVTTDSDLRNRGVQDILIAVVDGLKGFPQTIEAAHRGGIPPAPGPDLHCPPATPFNELRQVQAGSD